MIGLLNIGIDSLSFILSIDYYTEFILAAMIFVVIVYIIRFIKGWCINL